MSTTPNPVPSTAEPMTAKAFAARVQDMLTRAQADRWSSDPVEQARKEGRFMALIEVVALGVDELSGGVTREQLRAWGRAGGFARKKRSISRARARKMARQRWKKARGRTE